MPHNEHPPTTAALDGGTPIASIAMAADPTPSTEVAIAAGEDRPPMRRSLLLALAGAVVVLVLGLGGRWLVADGVENSFLADWLPWLSGTDVTLYFEDPSSDYLVPVSRTLTGDEENVAALAATLLAGPNSRTGLVNPIPTATTIHSVSHDGAEVTIDLSRDFLDDSSELALYALTHSLASWPDVEDVLVSVEGVELDSPVERRLVFFYDPARDMLVARPTAATTGRDVLAEYLAGPGTAELVGLPADVVVLQFESAAGSGLMELNFRYTDSLRTLATDDGDAMRRILEGLIATLTTASETNFVYLDFEGHATLGLGQCANLLRRVQPPPEVLNDERLLDAS